MQYGIDATPLKIADAPFSFDYHHVSELLIVKADPQTGDRWSAHLTPAGAPGALNFDQWEIRGVGGAPTPGDIQADSFFVLHLLDTLRTLRVEQIEVSGPPVSLGLDPPRFALKWHADHGEMEVRIGAPTEKAGSAYAQIPGQKNFVISGATMQMLEYVSSLSSLRLKNWTGLTADDVDEVEIPGPGPGSFYAQREGAAWTDRKHKPLRGVKDFAAWLDKVVHQRVQSFVDDPVVSEKLQTGLAKNPLRQATFKDRHGQAIRLQVARIEGKWVAQSSARPRAVFEVFPESSQALEPPLGH